MKLHRLIALNAKVDKLIEFQRYDENGNLIDDGPGIGTAVAGAGALGAGYAGQSMYRGLKTMQGQYGGGLMPTSAGQAWTATKMGHAANMADIGGAMSSGVNSASAAAAPYANSVKQAAASVGSGVQDRLAAMRAAQPFSKAGSAVSGAVDRVARAGRQVGGFFSGLKAAGKYEIGKAGGIGGLANLSTLRKIGTRALTRGKYTFSARHSQLVHLNSKIDQINFQHPYDEEESHGLRNAAIGAGALGVGYGGYRYAKDYASPSVRGVVENAENAIKGAYGKAKSAVADSGVGQAFTKGADRAAYAGEGRMASLLRGLRGAARSVTKGRSKMVGLSIRHSQLVQLNAKLDKAIEFRMPFHNDEGERMTEPGGYLAGGALAGAAGVYGGMKAYPHIKRKGSAAVGAFNTGMQRGAVAGKDLPTMATLRRAVSGAAKAARYA